MRVRLPALLPLLLILGYTLTSNPPSPKPIFPKTYICIMTYPDPKYQGSTNSSKSHNNSSYVSASYVKYLSQTGAVPLVVPWDLPWEELASVLGGCNGVLLPGGGASLVVGQGGGRRPSR